MAKQRYLDNLIYGGSFRFDRLSITDIDNTPVARIFSDTILEQEICLFSNEIKNGDDFCCFLHQQLASSMQKHLPLPVVRFADGEYAFYSYTLGCNGLYKQAESVAEIKKAMPLHISAMNYLAAHGLFAPLVFPGNSCYCTSELFSIRKSKEDSSGADFLNFLHAHNVDINAENYVPFYVIYSHLSSALFAASLNGKNVCILNSEFDPEHCRVWFDQFNSRPNLSFVDIPAEYVATRWEESKKGIMNKIPAETDLCLVGAGVGALLICTDIAAAFSIPAIDAGHVLNMMNGRVDKSNGARLYTLRNNHE